jgi:hypothetical protein
MRRARDMNAAELADALSAALALRDGWPLQAKLVADGKAAGWARRLVECLQGDPELSRALEATS